jgi:hypothetical protein
VLLYKKFVAGGNRFDAIRFPTDKGMLFERFDFNLTTRINPIGGRDRYPPQFNNPAASPNTTWGDGSVAKANIRNMLAAAAGSPAEQAVYRPPGTFGLSSGMTFDLFDSYSSGVYSPPDIPFQLNEAFPEFMWGTRNGIAGRDRRHR